MICKTTSRCQCSQASAFRMSSSRALVRHQDKRTGCHAKNLFRMFFLGQMWVRWEQLRLPVSAVCMQCQIHCIAKSDKTQTFELALMGKILFFWTIWTRVCAIRATTTPFPCHVHAISDPVYHGTRYGNQTFELAVINRKIFSC